MQKIYHLIFSLIVSFSLFSVFGLADAGWTNCRNLTVYDTREEGEVTRVNDLIDSNITNLTFNNAGELRVFNASCSNGGTEQPYVILDSDNSLPNRQRWARILFLVNKTAGSNTTYSVYYNNTNATFPNYQFIDYAGGSTTRLLEHFSGSLIGTIEGGNWSYLSGTGWGTSIRNDQEASSRISESADVISSPSGAIDFYWKAAPVPAQAYHTFVDTVGQGSAYNGAFGVQQNVNVYDRLLGGIFAGDGPFSGWYHAFGPYRTDFISDRWYRITFGYNSTKMMIRVSDGYQIWFNIENKDATSPAGVFFIGGSPGTKAFNGTMDEFRWYDYTFIPLSVTLGPEETINVTQPPQPPTLEERVSELENRVKELENKTQELNETSTSQENRISLLEGAVASVEQTVQAIRDWLLLLYNNLSAAIRRNVPLPP